MLDAAARALNDSEPSLLEEAQQNLLASLEGISRCTLYPNLQLFINPAAIAACGGAADPAGQQA